MAHYLSARFTRRGVAAPRLMQFCDRALWAAGLVFLTFALGWIMVAVPLLYQTHKTTGLLVLLMVLGRVWLRATWGRQAWTGLRRRRQRAAIYGELREDGTLQRMRRPCRA